MCIVQIARVQEYAKVSQYVTAYRMMSLKSTLTRLLHRKFNQIYMHYSDAQQNSLLRKWIHITGIEMKQGHAKKQKYITVNKKNLFNLIYFILFYFIFSHGTVGS